MLAPKKMDKKRLTAYIVIIVTMFVSSGFLLYKNYFLTSSQEASESVNMLDLRKFDVLLGKKDEQKSTNKEIKEGEILGGNIFNNPKFHALKDSFIRRTYEIKAGRGNPFEPY
jgi:hypothetical protein